MAISKDRALYNISKAYLDFQVANRLFWDTYTSMNDDVAPDYYSAKSTYQTMRICYRECGILTYDEMDATTENKYKLEKIEQAE